MARVLLAVQSNFPDIRATINVRFDDGVERALQKSKSEYTVTSLLHREGTDPVLQSIQNLLHKLRKKPEAIVDAGGLGIEPMMYLFADTATNVVRKAIGIAHAYAPLASVN